MKIPPVNIFYFLAFVLLSLSCNKEVSVTEPAIKPSQGFVYLETIPTGANIYLNGIKTGQITPDSIKWLNTGENKILLRLKGYRDSSITVNIADTQKQYITVDFTKNPSMRGSIEITSDPTGASIIFNDSILNKITPLTIKNLLPGKYKINLRKVGFIEDTVFVNVESAKTQIIERELVDSTVWVTFRKSNSGLPSNFPSCIAVDKSTNEKWIGTADDGVAVFNEIDWKLYNISNSPLPDNKINKIFIDDQNIKWIGTVYGGLAKFDGTSWTIYNTGNSDIPGDNITSIKKDRNNNIWITTFQKGIAKYDGSNWIKYNLSDSAGTVKTGYDIEFDDSGNVYLATIECGIIRFDGLNIQRLTYKNKFMGTYPTSIKFNNGFLYAGFFLDYDPEFRGFRRMKNGKWYKSENRWEASFLIYSFTFDKFNEAYVAAGNGFAIYRIIGDIFFYRVYLNKDNSPLGNYPIYEIAVDNNNVKWIASFGGGLYKYKTR